MFKYWLQHWLWVARLRVERYHKVRNQLEQQEYRWIGLQQSNRVGYFDIHIEPSKNEVKVVLVW